MSEGSNDKVQCQICGKWYEMLASHIKTHGMTTSEYREKYPSHEITSKRIRDLKSGKNHPMYRGKIAKTCVQCRKLYNVVQSLSESSKYCSKECKNLGQQTKRIVKICTYCGKTFEVIASKNGKKFCSMKCRTKYQVGENNCNYKPKEKLTCLQCGKVYEVVPSATSTSKFCSVECKGEHQKTSMLGVSRPHKKGYKHTDETKDKLRLSHIGANNPAWKEKIQKVCEYCGNNFEVIPSLHRLRFCSVRCSANANRGTNNSNWNGGISFGEYCPKFNNIVKRHVREKYNNCDYVSGVSYIVCNNGRRLDVHHIDYNKQQGCDDHEWRLIPVSRSNNAKANFNRTFWNRLFTYSLEYDKTYYREDDNELNIVSSIQGDING